MVTHYQISITVTPNQIELLSELFSDLGADAVTMIDAKDEPLFQLSPEDNPHWQHTTLQALFNATIPAKKMIDKIKKNHPEFQACHFDIEKIENKNWVEETQKQFHAQKFGKLWICPQWEKNNFLQAHKNAPVVFIEPGLAFGTGTHPTTQLCLTWIAKNVAHESVIDYGCGSGILALAALALGAKIVFATDHDPQALESTGNNYTYNHFNDAILHVRKINEMQLIKTEIVIANILANPLIELAPTLTQLLLPNGKLILSGILSHDADRVFAAYQNHFTRIDTQEKEGWVLMELHQ